MSIILKDLFVELVTIWYYNIIDDVIYFLKLKFGIVITFLLFKIENIKRSRKPKTVCKYDKYWMRYDILKLEKLRVNK